MQEMSIHIHLGKKLMVVWSAENVSITQREVPTGLQERQKMDAANKNSI
jgi:predicted proteasome-type protease